MHYAIQSNQNEEKYSCENVEWSGATVQSQRNNLKAIKWANTKSRFMHFWRKFGVISQCAHNVHSPKMNRDDHKSARKSFGKTKISFGVDTSFEFIHKIFGRFTWSLCWFSVRVVRVGAPLPANINDWIESNRIESIISKAKHTPLVNVKNCHLIVQNFASFFLLFSLFEWKMLDALRNLCKSFSRSWLCINQYSFFYSKYFLIFRGHSIAQTLIT